jgi:S-adenosylmethionine-dependent methyltransferase
MIELSKWAQSFPNGYMESMRDILIREHFNFPNPNEYLETQAGQNELELQTYGRMQQAHDCLIPWLEQGCQLQSLNVLEIGCGTGSSTVPVALKAKSLLGIDIDPNDVRCAQYRCELFALKNVELKVAESTWLNNRESFDELIADFPPNVIICYAVLEHLLIPERILCLRAMWECLPEGGILVTYETPNRLFWWDWHGSKMPFFEWLPEELASVFYVRSPRADCPRSLFSENVQDFDDEKNLAMYRWGRGVSYHEYDLAIGLAKMEILLDGFSPKADHRQQYMPACPGFEEALLHVLEQEKIPRGFACPSLDLVIKKHTN